MSIIIRPIATGDANSVWAILEPIIRSGETYALPQDLKEDAALRYWLSEAHQVFIAEENGHLVGTYYLKANHQGGGSHVANCGYATSPAYSGRGIATAMCLHSLVTAREQGFSAMQFNFVVATNERAIALWRRHGFATVGCLPQAFRHPTAGLTDAFVMYRAL